jgi:5-methylcytosine-specific restriction endonuclease McrA
MDTDRFGLIFRSFLSPWDKPAFVREAEERMSAIRKPPRPPGWSLSKGHCRFCAGEIRVNNGVRDVLKTNLTWHPWPAEPCRHLWAIANDPSYARVQVFLRDQGVCSYCGTDTKPAAGHDWTWEDVVEELRAIKPQTMGWSSANLGGWEVEHELPLWLVDKEAEDALRYWLMGNLKTCCRACHGPKTAREASARAKVNRIVAADGLKTKPLNKREKAVLSRSKKGAPF